jgi:hypothetical protein
MESGHGSRVVSYRPTCVAPSRPNDVFAVTEPKRMPRSARENATFERPYAPGWFDRLTDWVDRMPARIPSTVSDCCSSSSGT